MTNESDSSDRVTKYSRDGEILSLSESDFESRSSSWSDLKSKKKNYISSGQSDKENKEEDALNLDDTDFVNNEDKKNKSIII